jgi:hypothetical protein
LRQAKQKTSWQGSVVTTAVDLVPGSKDLSDLALPFCSPTVLPDFGQKNGRFRKKMVKMREIGDDFGAFLEDLSEHIFGHQL